MKEVLAGVDNCIFANMNDRLNRAFSNNENFTSLKSMSLLNAFEEDGLGVVFYQRFWHILGSDVAHFSIGLLQGDTSLSTANRTYCFDT